MNISKNFINKIFSKEAISSLVVILIVFILDRALKIKIINKQENSNGSIFINDYLNLDLVWNTGIGFGLLSQNANIYYHLTSLLIFFVIIFLIYLLLKAILFEKILYSLIQYCICLDWYDKPKQPEQ